MNLRQTAITLLKLAALAGGLGLALATLLGLLAPWVPLLELFNHFRPVLVAGALALLAFTLLLRWRPAIWLAAAITAVNLILFAAAIYGSAASAGDGADKFLRVVSLNVWVNNPQSADIADFVLREDGDIVVLTEVSAEQNAKLREALGTRYPHVLGSRGVLLLSKRAPIASGHVSNPGIDGWGRVPLINWARFQHDGMTFELAGVHLAWPFNPLDQVNDIDTLIGFAKDRDVPLIVAGDFNLTPWSLKLQRFRRQTGLGRTFTFALTWPVKRIRMPFSALNFPIVGIDNVFVSKEFAVQSAEVGPYVGSDHKPVIADLVLGGETQAANRKEVQP